MAEFLLHSREGMKLGSKAKRMHNHAKAGADRDDPTAQLRVKTRRRLIGAAVLLLAVVIIVPAILDPAPRPLPESIPIDIPGESSAFTPRLSLPPLSQPQEAGGSEEEVLQAAELGDGQSATERIEDAAEANKVVKVSAEAVPVKNEKTKTQPVSEAKFVLQAAAFSRESSANALTERINKKGFTAYVRKVRIGGKVHFRVRVGPYASHDEAQQAHVRLRKAGIKSDLVSL